MSKYIRTKDGIYELEKVLSPIGHYYKNESVLFYSENGTIEKASIKPYKIDYDRYFGCSTKQADTIEELCDEFVIFAKDNKCTGIVDNFNVAKYQSPYNTNTIYGAIWTDKGLIYVARMNDKGELELI